MSIHLTALIASLVDGLLMGFVYGLAAMGLTLIWGVMEVINLSHGALIALGMFGALLAVQALGLYPYLAFILVAVIGLVLGIIIYGIAIHRILDAPDLTTLLSTFAVSMIIIGAGTAIFTTSPRNIDFSLGSINIGTATILWTKIVAALLSILATILLYLFLYRTRTGKSIRAVSNNRDAAELMGIPSTRILALSFGIGTLLAMSSGALIATLFPFNILSGGGYELKSFVIGVMGGLGNPAGSLAGGLILGFIEGLIPNFMDTSWTPVIEFALFVLILLVKPQGLFGSEE